MKATRGRSRTDSDTKGAASAGVVFAVLAVVVVVVAGASLLLIPDPAGTPTPATSPTADATSPDLSLTDEEAIERFKELDRLRMRAYEERNLDLLRDVFAAEGRAFPLARSEIRRLTKDEVISATGFQNIRVDVVRNTPRLIELRQVRIIRPRFLTEAGEDITSASTAERQVVKWVLRPAEAGWLIYDSVVTKARERK